VIIIAALTAIVLSLTQTRLVDPVSLQSTDAHVFLNQVRKGAEDTIEMKLAQISSNTISEGPVGFLDTYFNEITSIARIKGYTLQVDTTESYLVSDPEAIANVEIVLSLISQNQQITTEMSIQKRLFSSIEVDTFLPSCVFTVTVEEEYGRETTGLIAGNSIITFFGLTPPEFKFQCEATELSPGLYEVDCGILSCECVDVTVQVTDNRGIISKPAGFKEGCPPP